MRHWFARELVPQSNIALLTLGVAVALTTMETAAGVAVRGGSQKQDPATLYQSYCSVCHGDQGNGLSRARASLNPPPSDFTLATAKANLSRERMIHSVREGRPGTAMIAWKTQLSDAQIAGVVDYVREEFMALGKQPPMSSGAAHLPTSAPTQLAAGPTGATAIGSSLALQKKLRGNMAAGRRLYEQNCVACHGKSGDGNGPRAYFIVPRPRSFISADSRAAFNETALALAIAQGKRGTEMPSWEKVLSNQQIADVSEFVFRQFITVDGDVSRRGRQ